MKKQKPKQRYQGSDGYLTADLLQYGRDHIASAGILFERSYSCFDSAAHLSHLGLELILKAVLLDVAGSFPNEHDLIAIFTEIRKHNRSFDLAARHRKTLAAVTRFVDLRYPDPRRTTSLGDSHWKRIRALAQGILRAMPKALQAELRAIDPTRKGGRILMSRPKTPWERAHSRSAKR